jgi:hypothetical protein
MDPAASPDTADSADKPKDLLVIESTRGFTCADCGTAYDRGELRIGRTAAGRALDPAAVRLAVVASVRHEDTDYDELLMGGIARFDARQLVRPVIDVILDRWQPGTIGS